MVALLAPLPTLYVGIDVSKLNHIAALISPQLLSKHGKYTTCPTLVFGNSRAEFQKLTLEMQRHAPLQDCIVLLEHTGHYHLALMQYLLECGVQVFVVHVYHHHSGDKNDKRDAQALAALLYNQIGIGAQLAESAQLRRVVASSEAASLLRPLAQHRYELGQRATQCKNKLTAICDTLFPEFTQCIRNPNCDAALAIREHYPTPVMVAAAPLRELKTIAGTVRLGFTLLTELQRLAAETIGLRDSKQVSALVFGQAQLIAELKMTLQHIDEIDLKIKEVVLESREGQILCSIPCVSTLLAARIIASVGSIGNFESVAKLRKYFGWAPCQDQTGKSFDRMTQTRGGNRLMKQTMYLLALSAVKDDTEWKTLFDRLVPLKCQWDARKGVWKGKNKVLGRVAGQMISVIYRLLRDDYDLQAQIMPDKELPAPQLYDAGKHYSHHTHRR